jgi:putative transposon-encoded protein
MYILHPLVRKIHVEKGKLVLTDDVTCFFQKTVTPFGNGAKIDCPKKFLGKTVYVVVVEE